MSAKSIRPSHSQSQLATPPGETITYMSVVHGRKTSPNTGQIHHKPLGPLSQALGAEIVLQCPLAREARGDEELEEEERGKGDSKVEGMSHGESSLSVRAR